MDDKEMARALVAAFLSDVPLRVRKLGELLGQGDASGFLLQAHTIKGAAENMSAPGLRDAAFELEKSGKAGRIEDALAQLPRLETEFARLKEFLEQGGWT
jgi:HPt (histidine-containing phosphotransfer) domain-containing protein